MASDVLPIAAKYAARAMRWPRVWFAIALTALIWGNAVPAADALTTQMSSRSVDLDCFPSGAVHPRCVLFRLDPHGAERSAAQRHAEIYIWDPSGGPNELVQVRVATTPATLSFAGSLWAATDRNSSVIAWVGRTADTGAYDRVHYRAFGTPILMPSGDANGDGVTDFSDYVGPVLAAFGETIAPDGTADIGFSRIDVDQNGAVAFSDVLAVFANMGEAQEIGRIGGLTAAAGTNSGPVIGYAGAIWDPDASLCLMRYRWHDPSLGRFLSRDPAGYTDGSSLYLYALGNPLAYFDPMGLGAIANCVAGLASMLPEGEYRERGFLAAGAVQVAEDAAEALWESATTDPVTGEQTALPSFDNVGGHAAMRLVEDVDARARVNTDGAEPGAGDLAFAAGQVVTGMDKLGNALGGADPVSGRLLSAEERLSQGSQGFGMGVMTVAGGWAATRASVGALETITAPAAKTSGTTSGLAAGRGVNNPVTRAAMERGREAHEAFAEAVSARPGWQSQPTIRGPRGNVLRPDALDPKGRPVELKPRTPSGIRAGEQQIRAYKQATGTNGRVTYYDP